MEEAPRKQGSPWRELLVGGGHLAALWAFAFVQPLLDLLGKNPDFFVARSNTGGDIVILALAFAFVPPLALMGVEALALLVSRTAYRVLHFGLLALLAAIFVVQIQKQLYQGPSGLMIVLALGAGLLVAWAILRSRFVKNLFDVLAFAPIVIVALFIFASDTSGLIFPDEETGALGAKVESRTPVVMIVMDEFPTATLMDDRGRLDARRFPNFAELARHSTWYRNNSTVADFTSRAVPAIFTGNNPDIDTLPTAAEQPNSIFSLLGGTYKLHVSEAVTQICSSDLCGNPNRDPQGERLGDLWDDLKYVEGRLILPPSIANTLPDVSTTFGNFGNNGGEEDAGSFVRDLFTPPSPGEFEEFIDEIPAGDDTLSVLHMELPHEPWRYLVSGQRYNGSPIAHLLDNEASRWEVGSDGIATSQARHYIQTGYADTLVGLLIDKLRTDGLWDEAMVIVTADHGISFQGRNVPPRDASKQNVGAVANPPLFIKYPGQRRGKVSNVHTRSIDIVPTIAQRLGVSRMYETEGRPISEDGPAGQVSVRRPGGYEVKVPVSYMLKQRRTVIRQTTRRLGRLGLYRLGPDSSIIGTRVPPGGTPTGQATLDDWVDWDDVDPDDETVPSFISGTLEGVPDGTVIAVAVGGVIRGTSRSFTFEDDERFGSVVPARSFLPGANRIEVYEVGNRGELTLIGSN